MPVDDSPLLPNAPPPNPGRRDAAIDAALRRFDGLEEPKAAPIPQRRRGFGSRPQFGALVTASLVVVLGIPAALIAIRDNQVPPTSQKASQPVHREAANVARAPDLAVADAVEPAEIEPAQVQPNLPSPNRRSNLSDENEIATMSSSPVAAYEPAAPGIAAPAPPPPPASPPPGEAERDEAVAEDSQIVVTGSSIQRAVPMAESIRDGRGRSVSFAQKSNVAATAPKWVLDNGAYRSFLGQLQSAVRANNRPAVVRLVRLPLRVNFAGGAWTYRDAKSILADYDRIFTSKVKQAIAAQRFENLFGRDQGVMIGDGAVWFDHTCRNTSCSPPGPVRISAINP